MTGALGLIYDQLRPDERMLIESAKKLGISLEVYNANEIAVDITGTNTTKIAKEPVLLQRCIGYFKGLHLTAILESQGHRVINSYAVSSVCGNKLLMSMILARNNVPTPKTVVAFDKESALKAFDEVGYPAVLKPIVGSWGRLIALVKDPESAQAIIEPREYMHPIQQIYYVQELVPKPDRDIRCFVVGDRAVAAMYRQSPGWDWRTNAARGASVENCPITSELEELSVRAAKAVGGGVFGVDLMESKHGLVVHEINNTSEFKHLVAATGVDVPKSILEYAQGLAKC